MHKKNILNLTLFVFALSLVSIIYFSEEKNTELEKLSTINKTDITSITIQHNEISTKIIKQKNNHWQITQPVKIPANDFRINSILKLINAPVHSKYLLSEVNLSDIGLSNPTTSIQLNEKKFIFGIINTATNLRYVQLDEFVYTIEDVYFPLLSSHFGTLVSLNLLPENSNIEKLILSNQTISKNEKDLWRSNITISADNINKTIAHWQQDQAFGVHEYLERKQLGEVFIFLKDQPQAISYLIADTDPWLILARPEIGLEYHLDGDVYKNLIAPK
ncbi:hypothetical protein MNBD_GAMMA06-1379 [hydrothermal vent metagenome]|uniref:DUF4340 domain-containing protein n=1 Tax=hydrothermal vent metagenome TaxID=652676 RepID=A0A3B0WGP1_9ZZZZ